MDNLKDLKVDDLLEKKPNNNRKLVYKIINEHLDLDKWSTLDLSDGRIVELFPELEEIVDKVIWDYRFAGWEVFHIKEGYKYNSEDKRNYLVFTNPAKRTYSSRKNKDKA